ncbi:hypothetical protein Bca4012_090187 [Brassica carinata]
MITAGGSMDYLISVNLYETCNKNFGLSINRKGISIAREQPEQTLFISQAFFSKGLLLCVWRNNKSRLLVWNLYWGKRRWIECLAHCLNEKFAFGYDRSCGSHKILRFSNDNPNMEIYYLSSDSWRTYDASFNRNTIKYTEPGLSPKGNTYWYARDYESGDAFLHCFDFTRERFGPRLPLPQCSYSFYTVSLSSVKEEKPAVLFATWDTASGLDIWVTNKIEPCEKEPLHGPHCLQIMVQRSSRPLAHRKKSRHKTQQRRGLTIRTLQKHCLRTDKRSLHPPLNE